MIRVKFLSMILCLAIMLTSVQPAHAASGVWKDVMSVSNISGISDAYSGRIVTNYSASLWVAGVRSYTNSPAISITLGWTSFSATENCGGRPVSAPQQGSPRSVYQTTTSTTMNIYKRGCTLGRVGYSNGNNEFKTSSTTKTHQWSHSEPIN
jgi:hypothetical protein